HVGVRAGRARCHREADGGAGHRAGDAQGAFDVDVAVAGVKRHPLPIFLAAVFAVKLLVLLQLRDHPLLQANAGLDTTVYTTLASKVLAGNTSLAPGLYFISPLYIYFLASLPTMSDSLYSSRLIQFARVTYT